MQIYFILNARMLSEMTYTDNWFWILKFNKIVYNSNDYNIIYYF